MPHAHHDRQQILQHIIDYKKAHDGNSPTFRNIMQACGISSSGHMQYILNAMEAQGTIRIAARSIEVVGGRWEYTAA